MLRPGRSEVRPTAQVTSDRPPPQRHKTFPAPIHGWAPNENVAMPSPMTAVVMDNWFPEMTGVRLMGGSVRHASVGDEVVTSLTGTIDIDGTTDVVGTSTLFESELSPGDKIRIDGQDYIVDEIASDTALTVTTATHDTLIGESLDLITYDLKPVETLFSYHSGGVSMFFASDETAVYDITAPADPDTPPSPAISGKTSGYYSAIPFTTSGGQFLYILNGTDEAQLFNGTTWTAINGISVPAITNVNTEDLSQGWVYRNRLMFVEKDTMNVWFPNVASLGGSLQSITMNGIFRRGGSVLFGATWSLDAGDGLDDKCVIVSTEGEVAVFEGSNPAGTQESDWRLVGVYDCPRPMGKNGWLRVGGDLLVLTEEGAIPVSAIMQKDPAALTISAVSRPIEPEWITQAVRRRALPWEMVKWPGRNMGIVNVPAASASDDPYCYVVNLKSGAWARRTGWDTRCLHVYNGQAYFGTNSGHVMLADAGGLDDGQPYEAFLVNHFDHLDAPGQQKEVGLARAVFIAEREFSPVVGASTNYVVTETIFPGSVDEFSLDVWDVGLWDEAVWDAEGAQAPVIRWNVVGRTGFAIAWQIGVTSATTLPLRAELKSVDLTYQVGDLVA